ncbi:MAG: HAD hydrolase-like protein [Dermatophilaceae bacterium]|nr:HAD hydrolase-like protein [Dermatophilaceae bacterium]MBP9918402.1 HAD hydrolase-like protein [Dermatophilaceae bacterium]
MSPEAKAAAAPRWETVVFDLDGTLVDTIGLIVASYQHATQTVLGEPWDARRIRGYIGRPLIECFREGAPEHADALFAAYTAWNEAHPHLIAPYAGIDAMLRALHDAGVQVAVATSKRREPALMALERCGIADLMPILVTMEDTDVHKPNPEPLLLALERAGGDIRGAAYVGDAAVDLLAAAAAGMPGVGVAWGAGERDALVAQRPYAVCDTVADLTGVLLPGL